MGVDTEAGTIGRIIRITAAASLTRTIVSRAVSGEARPAVIEATIVFPVGGLVHHPAVSAVEGSAADRPVGLREDSMGLPADNPVDNDSTPSGTRRLSEDRISLTRIDRQPRRPSLKLHPHRGADSAIARRRAL